MSAVGRTSREIWCLAVTWSCYCPRPHAGQYCTATSTSVDGRAVRTPDCTIRPLRPVFPAFDSSRYARIPTRWCAHGPAEAVLVQSCFWLIVVVQLLWSIWLALSLPSSVSIYSRRVKFISVYNQPIQLPTRKTFATVDCAECCRNTITENARAVSIHQMYLTG